MAFRRFGAARKEWDEKHGCWKDKPRHDSASHGADAFRILACAYRDLAPPAPPTKPKGPAVDERGLWTLTVDQLIKIHGEPKKLHV